MDHKEILHQGLRRQRDALFAKLDGLPEREVRLPRTPTGTNLLGLLKHAATCELEYFGEVFGRPAGIPLPWDAPGVGEEDGADLFAAEDETLEDVLDYARRCFAHADATIEALVLDARGRVPWWPAHLAEVTLAQILSHVALDAARHAGHADILREGIDGQAGLPVDPLAQDVGVAGMAGRVEGHVGEDLRQSHLGQVRGPPGDPPPRVEDEGLDGRVRVREASPRVVEDVLEGLVLGGEQVRAVLLAHPRRVPGQGDAGGAAEDLAEVLELARGRVLEQAQQVGAGGGAGQADLPLGQAVQLREEGVALPAQPLMEDLLVVHGVSLPGFRPRGRPWPVARRRRGRPAPRAAVVGPQPSRRGTTVMARVSGAVSATWSMASSTSPVRS